MIKRWIAFAALALLVASVASAQVGGAGISGLRVHDHSSAAKGGGTLALSGSLSSTAACASGYTRIGPNLCLQTGASTYVGMTRDACTTVAAPTGAKAVLLTALLVVRTANAVAQRDSGVAVHDTSGCTTYAGPPLLARIREEVATATTVLAEIEANTVAVVIGGNIFLRFTDDAGNNGIASYSIRGYWD